MANSNMTFSIAVDNTDKVGQELVDACKRALEICGGKAETYAKINCPVRTGNLRNSITHDVAEDGKSVTIGTDVEYGMFVELGHIQEVGRYVPAIGKGLKNEYVKPRPFLRPAIENHLSEYKSIIESELKG